MESPADAPVSDRDEADRSRPFALGPWRVTPDANEISHAGRVVRLEPKAMRLLVLLADHAGRTVPREAIVERLWDGRAVTDDAINRQIAKLREALGDDPKSPRFIRTIPRTGLQLIAPVVREGPGRRRPSRAVVALAASAVAVLAAALGWAVAHPGAESLGVETRLTSDVGSESHPGLSPDGRRLAYVGGEDQAVLIRALDDPRTTRLSPPGSAGAFPAWSPSGRQIAYLQTHPRCEVVVASVAALSRRTAWRCDGWSIGGLSWRDDRRLLIAAGPTHEPSRIVQLDLASGRLQTLTHPPSAGLGDSMPVWSSKAQRIFFVRSREASRADRDVFALDPQTGAATASRRVGGWFNGAAPGGAGRLTVIATGREGLFRLWRVDPAAGRWTPLSGPGDYIGISASHDGRTLVYGKAAGTVSLIAGGLASDAGGRVLTTSTGIDLRPTSCGGRIAFLSTRAGAVQIWELEGAAAPSQLTRLKAPPVEFACSRDGGLYVAGVNRDGRYRLLLINRTTGAVEEAATLASGLHAPAISADGSALYYVRDQGGPALFRRELASDRETLVSHDVTRAVPSPDGSALYFTRTDSRSLWRRDLATGGETRLAVLPVRFAAGDFALGRDGVFVAGPPGRGGGAQLYRVPLAGGAAEPVRRLPDMFGELFGFAVQGDALVYPRLERLDVDLYRAEVRRGGWLERLGR
jgi:DNA-binding winged helix-turn-helix (wHTH) protein/Tol biopolymer transport system component